MKTVNLRIFLTTSHISTVYLTMLAKNTHIEGDVDVLLVDTGHRRPELLLLIQETGEFHNWDLIHSFSEPLDESHDYKPTLKRKIIREIKTWPVLKTFYDKALDQNLNKRDERYSVDLAKLLEGWTKNVNPHIELFLMTRTYLNRPLQKLFPSASINYLEHGMGDYYYALEDEGVPQNFYCVFYETYRKFVDKLGKNSSHIKALPGKNHFSEFAEKLMERHSKTLNADNLPNSKKPIVFILLEAVDMYNVKDSFWTEYIDHILTQIQNPKNYFFILKPHPMHSKHSIEKTENHFIKLGLEYSILRENNLSSAAAEVLFSKWATQTDFVFCLFSSSCFYLSELYKDEKIKFYYSTEFLSKYIGNAPPQYHKLFVEIRPLIEEVLTDNCIAY